MSEGTAALLRRLLNQHFAPVTGRPQRILQFGGQEINSDNFRIETAKGTFLLKKLPQNTPALPAQIGLWRWLGEQGAAVPRVHHNHTGSLLTAQHKANWCLFEFVAGNFFPGGDPALDTVGRAMGRLFDVLSRCPAEFRPPRKWDYLTRANQEIFGQAYEQRHQWRARFGAPAAGKLARSWDHLARIVCELEGGARRGALNRVQPCHCDIHPHNVLVGKENRCWFIDFESVVLMPEAAAVGYALYKLIKRHAIRRHWGAGDRRAISAATRRMVKCFSAARPGQEKLEILRTGALAELVRRIFTVFRLNWMEGNAAWNHVLPMHLDGLQEIGIIFSGETAVARRR